MEISATCKGSKTARAAVKKLFKEEKGNLSALRRRGALEAGLEAALFGRMMTSDPNANTDAAIHVAHAFTVHKEETETDFFSVVDDLTDEAGELGAAGLFDTELTSGLFYGYVVIDIPGLINSLGQDSALGGKVAEHLVHLVATVSPGAKKGSTAPYSYAETMLIEAGSRQPRTFANAFRMAVRPRWKEALAALSDYILKIDSIYGSHETRRHLSFEDINLAGSKPGSLNDLALFARDIVAAWPPNG